MNELEVISYRGQPVADSREVAKMIGRPHYQLIKSIRLYCGHLGADKSIVSNFFIPTEYITEQGKKMPAYYLTRLGCDLVANKMTGERGTLFTAAYVTRFREMETELIKRQALREIEKPIRRTLTDAIRDNPAHSPHDYKHYTDLAYKTATGRTAAQLRKERGADKKATAADLLTSDELSRYERAESQIAVLIDLRMEYQQIKTALAGQAERM